MPVYNDSRYAYNNAGLRYSGALIASPLSGDQAAASAGLTDLKFHPVDLIGNQPAAIDYHYEEPGVAYDEPVYLYDFKEAGAITTHLNAFRTLLGSQYSGAGDLGWRWLEYVWPHYRTSVTDRAESTQYNARVATQDTEIRYRPDVGDEHDDPDEEIVYRDRSPRTYTKP